MQLSFKTVEWIDDPGVLRLLDQRLLPGTLTHVDLHTPAEVATRIADLTVRGAPAIGVAAGYGMVLALASDDIRDTSAAHTALNTAADLLKAARPTAVNLAWAVDRVLDHIRARSVTDVAGLRTAMRDEAKRIHADDVAMCDRIGDYGQRLLADGMNVLTHCNAGALATTGIGTALGVIYAANAAGKHIHVYADETRPVWQGARLTMWELMREGIDATLLCDNASGSLFAEGQIDAVIMGADRIAQNGDTANKIGTYNIAVLAAHHGVPFYVAAPQSTFDDRTPAGCDIPIEQRSPEEIIQPNGTPISPAGAPAYSPAFDITPVELITAFITDSGVRAGGRST